MTRAAGGKPLTNNGNYADATATAYAPAMLKVNVLGWTPMFNWRCGMHNCFSLHADPGQRSSAEVCLHYTVRPATELLFASVIVVCSVQEHTVGTSPSGFSLMSSSFLAQPKPPNLMVPFSSRSMFVGFKSQ